MSHVSLADSGLLRKPIFLLHFVIQYKSRNTFRVDSQLKLHESSEGAKECKIMLKIVKEYLERVRAIQSEVVQLEYFYVLSLGEQVMSCLLVYRWMSNMCSLGRTFLTFDHGLCVASDAGCRRGSQNQLQS